MKRRSKPDGHYGNKASGIEETAELTLKTLKDKTYF